MHVHDLIPARRSLIRAGAVCAAVLALPLTTHLTPAAAMTRHTPISHAAAPPTASRSRHRFVLPPAWSGIFAAERHAMARRAAPRVSASVVFGTTGAGCAVTSASVGAEHYILSLLNAHRAAAGVRPLALDPMLSDGARAHSCDMAVHGRLAHWGSDGSSPDVRMHGTGAVFSTWAENIGASGGGRAGIAAIDAGMMAEPLVPNDHHWNIVNPAMGDVGIGVVYQGGMAWFTEDFAG